MQRQKFTDTQLSGKNYILACHADPSRVVGQFVKCVIPQNFYCVIRAGGVYYCNKSVWN